VNKALLRFCKVFISISFMILKYIIQHLNKVQQTLFGKNIQVHCHKQYKNIYMKSMKGTVYIRIMI